MPLYTVAIYLLVLYQYAHTYVYTSMCRKVTLPCKKYIH